MRLLVVLGTLSTLALTGCSGGGNGSSSSKAAADPVNAGPVVTISAAPATVASGDTSTITWSATNADACTASGAWSGAQSTSGTFTTGPVTQTEQFMLSCDGPGGGSMSSATVAIGSGAAPTVRLTTADPGVALGTGTTLSWATTDASQCTASGDWSGSKGANGTENTGNLNSDTTYELSCSGPGGSALAMTTVTVRAASLTWEAPTENVDGTPVDLAGFKVHWGSQSRNYDNIATLNDPDGLSYVLELAPSTYYFAVTALAPDGSESAFSGEVSKTIF